jgi:hypothetical protein
MSEEQKPVAVDGFTKEQLLEVIKNGRDGNVPFMSCSWAVLTACRREWGWTSLLVFFDRDTLKPFFLYDFQGETQQMLIMAERLVRAYDFEEKKKKEESGAEENPNG